MGHSEQVRAVVAEIAKRDRRIQTDERRVSLRRKLLLERKRAMARRQKHVGRDHRSRADRQDLSVGRLHDERAGVGELVVRVDKAVRDG